MAFIVVLYLLTRFDIILWLLKERNLTSIDKVAFTTFDHSPIKVHWKFESCGADEKSKRRSDGRNGEKNADVESGVLSMTVIIDVGNEEWRHASRGSARHQLRQQDQNPPGGRLAPLAVSFADVR